MIRLCRRASRGPTYLQALSLVAAVRVASAIPKHMVAVARPIYGVSSHDEKRYAHLAKVVRSRSKGGFAVLKKVSDAHIKVGLVAAAIFALAYAARRRRFLCLS